MASKNNAPADSPGPREAGRATGRRRPAPRWLRWPRLRLNVSYQWRLFFPMIGLLWVLIAALMVWQYRHEEDYRTEAVRQQMATINARILFEREMDRDLFTYLRFMGTFYAADPVYRQLRVSVYDAVGGELIYYLGQPIPFDDDDRFAPDTEYINAAGGTPGGGGPGGPAGQDGIRLKDRQLYYAVTHSRDNNVVVYTSLPYNQVVADALLPDGEIWAVVLILAAIVTVFAYVSTHYFTRTVKVMRQFATRAAQDKAFDPAGRFPNDELGDIGRQIVHIFNERAQAMATTEQEHALAIQAAEEKNAIQRRMTSNITHELKTPVTIAKGYLDTLADNPDMDPADLDRFVTKAQQAINRMDNLIRDLLTLSRFDDGTQLIPTEPVDMHEAVFTVETEILEAGMAPKMHFHNQVPEGTIVRANFPLLVAMIHNLAKNAVSYSQGANMGVRLDPDWPHPEDTYAFTFYDDGVGVDPAHIPHLFERFYCVDSGRSRRASGTGLGLPIVRNVITAFGGSVEVTNAAEDQGSGLLFHFTLLRATMDEGVERHRKTV